MKYIVTSGCSFTRQYRRIGITGNEYDFMNDAISQWKWPHFIQKEYPDYKVLNYGNPTNDNSVIAKSILYGVNKLLKKGISTENIKVVVQWSGWSRNSSFISKQKQIENNYFLNKEFVAERDKDRWPINEDFAHINDFINEPKKYIGEHGYFILSGGYHNGHVKAKAKEYFEDYVDHIFSAEERMIEYLQNILLIQYFCKANGIEYKCFTMHNNFSADYVTEDRFPLWKPNGSSNSEAWFVINKKFIPSTWENDSKTQFENSPYIKYLFDMVDFKKFWFYKENGLTKYGGQVEWSIKRYNHDEVSEFDDIPNIIWLECRGNWDDNKRDKDELINWLEKTVYWQHTSPYLNYMFVKEELKSFLDGK
jgi:hypothetical protein